MSRLGDGSFNRESAIRVDPASGQVLVLIGNDARSRTGRVRVYNGESGDLVAAFEALFDGYVAGLDPEISLAGGAVWNLGRYRRLP